MLSRNSSDAASIFRKLRPGSFPLVIEIATGERTCWNTCTLRWKFQHVIGQRAKGYSLRQRGPERYVGSIFHHTTVWLILGLILIFPISGYGVWWRLLSLEHTSSRLHYGDYNWHKMTVTISLAYSHYQLVKWPCTICAASSTNY